MKSWRKVWWGFEVVRNCSTKYIYLNSGLLSEHFWATYVTLPHKSVCVLRTKFIVKFNALFQPELLPNRGTASLHTRTSWWNRAWLSVMFHPLSEKYACLWFRVCVRWHLLKLTAHASCSPVHGDWSQHDCNDLAWAPSSTGVAIHLLLLLPSRFFGSVPSPFILTFFSKGVCVTPHPQHYDATSLLTLSLFCGTVVSRSLQYVQKRAGCSFFNKKLAFWM